ncbi:hypothetical protein NB476_15225, partial [Vibrio sp. RM-44-3]|uniref:hypothetical protein n=1 Tax=Vibrio TaxID=662 RepID=UPI00215C8FBC
FTRSFSLKAEVHSSDLIGSVKHFFNFIFAEAFYLSDPAEALSPLPCRWMRIIGNSDPFATLFWKKMGKTDCSMTISSKKQKRG